MFQGGIANETEVEDEEEEQSRAEK
jgi:hypothetical protein